MPRKKQNKKNRAFPRFKASPKFEPRPSPVGLNTSAQSCQTSFSFFFFFSHESPARGMGWENKETHKICTGTKITRKQNEGKEVASLRSIVPNESWAKKFFSKKNVFWIFFSFLVLFYLTHIRRMFPGLLSAGVTSLCCRCHRTRGLSPRRWGRESASRRPGGRPPPRSCFP